MYTDMELPYTDHRVEKYSRIPKFCEMCSRRVRAWPAGAIYAEPKVTPDGRKQYIDHRKYAVLFSRTLSCSVSIKECTFSKSDFEKIKKGL